MRMTGKEGLPCHFGENYPPLLEDQPYFNREIENLSND